MPDTPATIVLFHSMYGLRRAELAAAERLCAAGYRVITPDLFAGSTVDGRDPAEGVALMERVGWAAIVRRAEAAVQDLPAETILAGLSMGVGVVGELWPRRPAAAAVVLMHALAPVPTEVAAGTPVQVHVAAGDEHAPAAELEEFRRGADAAGVRAAVHTYPGAGHFFTDASLPDFNADAAEQAWERVVTLLSTVAVPSARVPEG